MISSHLYLIAATRPLHAELQIARWKKTPKIQRDDPLRTSARKTLPSLKNNHLKRTIITLSLFTAGLCATAQAQVNNATETKARNTLSGTTIGSASGVNIISPVVNPSPGGPGTPLTTSIVSVAGVDSVAGYITTNGMNVTINP